MRFSLFIFSLLFLAASCSQSQGEREFVRQSDGHFYVGQKPYYFIGSNVWYAANLGSVGLGGNRARLQRELDSLQSLGVLNLRVLVGADGFDNQDIKVRPALQTAPGVYNDTIFDGLDYLLVEMAKRSMRAVLYLTNTWEWSGGYGQYLRWTSYTQLPADGRYDWPCYINEVSKFSECDTCIALLMAHVKHVITRTNRYTNVKYVDDPTIMAWEIGNEPRALNKRVSKPFAAWLRKVTAQIRSLDGNHLIALGNEGLAGCELDTALLRSVHADPNVSYITIHIWPQNWGWAKAPDVENYIDTSIAQTKAYIDFHRKLAEELRKPLVIEEFGYARDGYRFTTDAPTTARDRYYDYILSTVVQSAESNGIVAGCNFWAWNGLGRAAHERWAPWDDYLGDPTHEPQGWYGVFSGDSTLNIIKKYSDELR